MRNEIYRRHEWLIRIANFDCGSVFTKDFAVHHRNTQDLLTEF